MEVAAVIKLILSNFVVVLFIIAIAVAIAKIRRGTAESATSILLGETLFYCVGIGFLWAGIFHAFAQQTAAESIGWVPSPFEWELAWAEFGIAVGAIMSLWSDYRVRLTITLIFAIFCAGATIQHVNQIMCCQNYAPGNAGLILWFNDIALPLFLLALCVLTARERSVRTVPAR